MLSPVLHSHGLDVTLAEVKGQTAAVGILPADLWRVLGLRDIRLILHNLHLERLVGGSADLGHGHDFEFIGPT